jgi:hypothetical protein
VAYNVAFRQVHSRFCITAKLTSLEELRQIHELSKMQLVAHTRNRRISLTRSLRRPNVEQNDNGFMYGVSSTGGRLRVAPP